MGSLFDDFDRENGYLDDEEVFNENKTKYTDMLFHIYRTGIDNGVSFNCMEESNILGYIDYLCFALDHPRQDNDSEVSN